MENKKHSYFRAAIGLLSSFCLLFAFSIISSNTYATNSVVDDVTVTVPASCTMSSTVNNNHTATVEVGSYVDDIGETTFKVICNDSEGFSVYTVGYTNNEFGNTTMKPSVVADTNAIATGLATSGDTSNWAMKLAAVTGDYTPTLETGFNAYHVVPAEYTKVASFASNTDSSSGSSFKSTYAAFVASAQPADTYTGKVKYTVVHPANADTPLMKTIDELTYMQDFKDLSSDEKLSVTMSMQDSTVYTLIDNRDNKTYQIAKMKDGNIWMAENLDLGRTELTEDLTSENTNLEDTITASTFNGWYNTERFSYETTGQFAYLDGTDEFSGNAYGTMYNYCTATAGTVCVSGSNDIDAEYDICPAGWLMPSIKQDRKLYEQYHSSELMRAPITSGGAAYPLSGYDMYTGSSGWYWTSSAWSGSVVVLMNVATYGIQTENRAGRQHGAAVRCVAKNTVHSFTISYSPGISGITVNGEIVPNNTTITSERNTEYQIGAIPESRYAFDTWSASSGTIKESNDQYTTFTVGSSDTTISASATYVETEIQNFSPSNCSSTPTKVYDNRDGHAYTVQQLLDGNCWMMENLDLGRTTLTTDLTNANTNTTSTIAASTFNSWYTPGSSQSDGQFTYNNNGDPVAGITVGTYYNYYAATAGANLGESNTDDATQDICPAGWRLPTGGDYGETKNLISQYSPIDLIRTSKNSSGAQFPLFVNEKEYSNYSYFWTSTAKDSDRRYAISLSAAPSSESTTIDGTGYAYRSNKQFVRCIIKRPTRSITVSYGTGVSSVSIDGESVTSGTIVAIEQNKPIRISATLENRYTINTWSATSGIVNLPTSNDTTYFVGPSDATLSITATYVNTEMQNLSASSCTTTPSSVYDNRDNHVYIIQRLLDGKCWMMENLDLGRTTLSTDLTSSNTNLSNTITASTFNNWKKTTIDDSTYTFTDGVFYPVDGVDLDNRMPLGTLYNYYAVSAGTITGYTNTGDASYDICPAGWRLPTSGDSGEYETLYGYYGTNELMRAPIARNGLAFVSVGYFSSSLSIGEWSHYWSSTRYGYEIMYNLFITPSYVRPSDDLRRNYGCAVRCVLK